VYENRPLVCREFQAGSEDCHMVRRALRLEAA
jgi:Fe-S-cluster containining protein